MNWKSLLGIAGAGIAAPFTGGASLTSLPGILGAGGAALGAIGQSGATNRDAKFSGQTDLAKILLDRDATLQKLKADAQNDYFDQGLKREQEGRTGRESAWRGLLSAQHTLNPGAAPQLAGKYNIAPRQASDAERQGADALSAEVMARLQGGNPLAAPTQRDPTLGDPLATIDPRLLDAGKGEKIAGWLAPFLTGLGNIKRTQQPPIMQSSASGKMPVRY